ncbi:MAG: hypothetical protein JO027_11205 [Solirubrobacterales bacterium]|nr:hypothetical protein [Solirubrobacterales bacterium]
MASTLVLGSFLAASLLTLLLPVGLLIALVLYHTRSIIRMPRDPAQAAVHAAGAAEVEGRPDAGETAPPPTQT